MCRSLEDAKAAAKRANTEYGLASNASKEISLLVKESHDDTRIAHEREVHARTELQTMEKAVVEKRVQLLTEMIAHPSTAYNIQPPIPQSKLPAQETAVQYTYTVHTDGAMYRPQRDRAWRIPIVWTAVKPLFDKGTTDSSVDEALRQVLPHLTRFATGDNSTSGVRRWMASNLHACSGFRRMPQSTATTTHTRCPSIKTLHNEQPPVALYAAKGPNGSTVQVAVHAPAMESPEQWHNTDINTYVGQVLASSPEAMLTCTCIISDPSNGTTHYMSLQPIRSPDICSATHILVCDSHGILARPLDTASDHANTRNELQTYHCLPTQKKRFTEMELNSIHATAIAHNEELCHHTQPAKAVQNGRDGRKSARISSQHRDIIVSSFPTSTGEVYTTVSVFAYPMQGLAYKRDRSSPVPAKRNPLRGNPQTIQLPWGARPAQNHTPPQIKRMVRELQTRIDSLEAEKTRANGNRDHLMQKLLARLDHVPSNRES